MASIEFGKKCRPYNLKYNELFGYVPCKDDYIGTQEEFFTALVRAVNEEKDISEFIRPRGSYEYDPGKRYDR